MRLLDTCLLSLSAASFIIGVHQIITVGFAQGYWLIMISSILLLWRGIRKKNEQADEEPPTKLPKKRKSRPSPRRKKKSR